MPGLNVFKMYRGGQVFTFLYLIKANIRSLIAFKPNDLGTKGHMVNQGHTIASWKPYSHAWSKRVQNVQGTSSFGSVKLAWYSAQETSMHAYGYVYMLAFTCRGSIIFFGKESTKIHECLISNIVLTSHLAWYLRMWMSNVQYHANFTVPVRSMEWRNTF